MCGTPNGIRTGAATLKGWAACGMTGVGDPDQARDSLVLLDSRRIAGASYALSPDPEYSGSIYLTHHIGPEAVLMGDLPECHTVPLGCAVAGADRERVS